jgi:FeS assembly SUF system protein
MEDANPETQAPQEATAPEAGTPGAIREKIIAELHTVYDPEIPIDIYELGLIYDVDVEQGGVVSIRMTLTSPMCPAAEMLPPEVETKARGVEGVSSVSLDLVWDPPWSPDRMTEAARLELGMV